MNIALFFGSFNPVHNGHLAVAQAAINQRLADKVWFILSPLSPFKIEQEMLDENIRYDMVLASIVDNPYFEVSDIEFGLPKPSFTYQTIRVLKEKYPDYTFNILLGSDNLDAFHQWKNFKEILANCNLIVYPRHHYPLTNLHIDKEKIKLLDVPQLEISSTLIRYMLKQGKSVRYLVPDAAVGIIESMKYYHY